MKIEWQQIRGVRVRHAVESFDDRGTFAKLWDCSTEGPLAVDQVCSSSNHRSGTVRGLHLQVEPHPETKTLWCSTGSLWDVLVDLRPGEPSYGSWAAVELSAKRPEVVHVPAGVAHGYQTLADDTTIVYLISGSHVLEAGRTVPWNDPALAIPWPLAVSTISDKDRTAQPWAW